MFERIFPHRTQALLDRVSLIIANEDFYLAGGSGLALQIGHRVSEDLDFFKESSFNPGVLLGKLREAAQKVEVTLMEKDTLVAILDDVRLSFFAYEVSLIYPTIIFKGFRVADWRDITAEKFKTLAQRGSKKDFYDLYAVIHLQQISIKEAVDLLKKRFEPTGLNFYHILRSLAYFEDAEREPEPRLVKDAYTWEQVKTFFVENIREFERWITSPSPS